MKQKKQYNKHRKRRSQIGTHKERDLYRWFIASNRAFSKADTRGIMPISY